MKLILTIELPDKPSELEKKFFTEIKEDIIDIQALTLQTLPNIKVSIHFP